MGSEPSGRHTGIGTDLALRAVSGVVMAALALSTAWLGGVPFAVLWTAAAVAVLVEWQRLVRPAWLVLALIAGSAAIILAGLATALGRPYGALAVIVLGALAVFLARRSEGDQVTAPFRALPALGVIYAAATVVPIVLLRANASLGLAAVLFVFAIVWGSDIMAYVCGRSFGGPKLWPRVSPKKTWSGFLGGTFFGAAAGVGIAAAFRLQNLPVLFILGVLTAIISQGGDLLESSLKRRFGAKDASHLIPGHGGVMDRLDGFIAAASFALVVALCRDPAALPRGLLLW